MKTRQVGLCASAVLLLIIVIVLYQTQWLDHRSLLTLLAVCAVISFLEHFWQWLRKGKNSADDSSGRQPPFSSVMLLGYLTEDAFYWLKEKTEKLHRTGERKNR